LQSEAASDRSRLIAEHLDVVHLSPGTRISRLVIQVVGNRLVNGDGWSGAGRVRSAGKVIVITAEAGKFFVEGVDAQKQLEGDAVIGADDLGLVPLGKPEFS